LGGGFGRDLRRSYRNSFCNVAKACEESRRMVFCRD
jgi:hypothetical protein